MHSGGSKGLCIGILFTHNTIEKLIQMIKDNCQTHKIPNY